jgi:hypothetical protein
MENNKQPCNHIPNQSSVDWLQEIELKRDLTLADWNKAKEMHKKEVLNFELWLHKHEIDALNNNTILLTKEEFYNETFGGNK